MKYVLIYIFLLHFVVTQAQHKGIERLDSMVTASVTQSEKLLYDVQFVAAYEVLSDLKHNTNNLNAKHQIQIMLQEIKIEGIRSMVELRTSNNRANYERMKRFVSQTKNIQDKTVLGDFYYALSRLCTGEGNESDARFYWDKAMLLFEEENNLEKIAGMRALAISLEHNRLSRINKLEEVEALIPNYEKEIEFSARHSKMSLSYNTRHLAQIYLKKNSNLDKALSLFSESLHIRQEIGFKPFLPASYSSIGDVYIKMGNAENAIDMYLKSLKLAEDFGFVRYKYNSNLQLGAIHFDKGDADKAVEYLKSALKTAEEHNHSEWITQVKEKLNKIQ